MTTKNWMCMWVLAMVCTGAIWHGIGRSSASSADSGPRVDAEYRFRHNQPAHWKALVLHRF